MRPYVQDEYYLRQLQVEDWQSLRAMRLFALLHSPGVYGSIYATELERRDETWQERLQNLDCAYFGLFLREEMVGMTGIFSYQNHPDQAVLISSYILEAHRKKGLSALLYEARIHWAKENGYKRLIVSHRADNLASRAANQRAGFTFTHTQRHLWPDGAEVDELFYKLDI